MEKAKFDALLPFIVTALIKRIIERKKITEDEAFFRLYNSELYSYLEEEETKVWYYSADKLFMLFDEEILNGKLELPEF